MEVGRGERELGSDESGGAMTTSDGTVRTDLEFWKDSERARGKPVKIGEDCEIEVLWWKYLF